MLEIFIHTVVVIHVDVCGPQQHRSWDTNRLAELMRKALRLEVTVLHPGSSIPPSTPPAEQSDATRLDMVQ